MVIANCADAVDVGAVDGRDVGSAGRENLNIPVWWLVWRGEDVGRQKVQGRAVEACCHYDHGALDEGFATGSILRNTLGTVIECYTGGGHVEYIAAQPGCLAGTDEVEDLGVDHGGIGEEAFVRRREIREVAVEEEAEDVLGDPGEKSLLAEDIECEEHVDERVARDDPLVGAAEDGDVGGAGGHDEFEGFDGGSAAADDQDLFALDILAVEVRGVVYFALELVLVWEAGQFCGAAAADGCDDALEFAVRWFVDDPSAAVIFRH